MNDVLTSTMKKHLVYTAYWLLSFQIMLATGLICICFRKKIWKDKK